MRYEGSGYVAAPPDVVFAFVADAENNHRWHAHVNETRWLDPGPTGPGRRGRQTGRLFWRDWEFVAEVADWSPPELVSFQVIKGPRIRTTLRVEPAGDGSRLTAIVEGPAVLGRRLDPWLNRVVQRLTESRGRSDIARLNALIGTSASAYRAREAPGPSGGDTA